MPFQERTLSAPLARSPPCRLIAVGYGLKEDKRSVMAMSRTGDPAELLRGPLYYAIVLLAVTLFYWRSSPVGECPATALRVVLGAVFCVLHELESECTVCLGVREGSGCSYFASSLIVPA